MPNSKLKRREKNKILSVSFDARFFFERGIRSLHKQSVPKAIKYLERCVDLDPANSQYLTHLAAAYTEIGEYERSNSLLTQIIDDVDETMTECYYYMANNYAHMGDFDQSEQYALMYLHEAGEGLYVEEAEELLDFICYELERTPKELDLEHKLIGKHEKARHCLEEGRFMEATKFLEEMVEEYPHFLAARNNLALSYYYLGYFDKAQKVIEEILSKDQANLHALCNLAVFYNHKGEEEKVKTLIEGLKKVHPFHLDHHYKLATTLGILGEDQRAFELFFFLVKKGVGSDVSLYHYLAVSAYNTQRWDTAYLYWKKVADLDPEGEIADYYLEILSNPAMRQGVSRLPYHYQLPYDVQMKRKDWFRDGKVAAELVRDPLIRSSLFWALRHGDQDTKLQVIQSFEFFADQEVENVLRETIADPTEEDYVKKVAIFVMRQMGAAPPYQAHLDGEMREIQGDIVDDQFPVWMAQWQKVIQCLRQQMEGNYDLLEHQEAQVLWTTFLRNCYPTVPKIRKAEGWAAAIEYLLAQNRGKPVTKKEIADRYGVSVSTLSRNVGIMVTYLG